jgi:hypothetical protein
MSDFDKKVEDFFIGFREVKAEQVKPSPFARDIKPDLTGLTNSIRQQGGASQTICVVRVVDLA